MEIARVHEVVNLKGIAKWKKVPIKKGKSIFTLKDGDDDEIHYLKDRLCAHKPESSLDQSVQK